MTLMPVTSIVVRDSRVSKAGAWTVDAPAGLDVQGGLVDVERLAQGVPHVALGHVADRHHDRVAGVGDGGTAGDAVGGLHGDRPDDVVTDVAGDLEGDGGRLPRELALQGEGVVDGRHRVGVELDVDDRADHADRRDRGRRSRRARGSRGWRSWLQSLPAEASASAPPTISEISWVISAWRAALAARVRLLMSSSALSVAAFMARRRAADSDAADVEQRRVDAGLDVARQQRVEQRLAGRLELVQRQRAVRRRGVGVLDHQRQDALGDRPLGERGDVLGVDDVDLVDARRCRRHRRRRLARSSSAPVTNAAMSASATSLASA